MTFKIANKFLKPKYKMLGDLPVGTYIVEMQDHFASKIVDYYVQVTTTSIRIMNLVTSKMDGYDLGAKVAIANVRPAEIVEIVFTEI